MRRLIVLAIVLGAGCRRHHAATPYASDTVAAPEVAAAPPVAAPPSAATAGEAANAPSAPPATAPRDAMPDGGTVNGDPRGPRAAELNKIVDSALAPLQACFDRAGAAVAAGEYNVTVHYVIEYPGYTGGVTARGDNVPKPVLDCCVGVIEGLKFPQYRGSKVERDLPFTYRKTEVGTPAGRDMAPAAK